MKDILWPKQALIRELRAENQELKRQLDNMTKAYATATKMVAELQEFVR